MTRVSHGAAPAPAESWCCCVRRSFWFKFGTSSRRGERNLPEFMKSDMQSDENGEFGVATPQQARPNLKRKFNRPLKSKSGGVLDPAMVMAANVGAPGPSGPALRRHEDGPRAWMPKLAKTHAEQSASGGMRGAPTARLVPTTGTATHDTHDTPDYQWLDTHDTCMHMAGFRRQVLLPSITGCGWQWRERFRPEFWILSGRDRESIERSMMTDCDVESARQQRRGPSKIGAMICRN